MNKLSMCLIAMLVFAHSAFALSNEDIPDEFSITQHWVSYTTSFDIETKNKKLGTLYRRVLSFATTYDFYDNFNVKLASARMKLFSFRVHFDVVDSNNQLIGIAEEKLFSFFPSFTIYSSDATTKLASATMNFWGTKFTLYDPLTDQEMATMSRPFFRIKNNWTIHITNPHLFKERALDPRVLMTVLAFQGDREEWERQERDQENRDKDKNNNRNRQLTNAALHSSKSTLEQTHQQTEALMNKIAQMSQEQGLDPLEIPNNSTLEALAEELQNEANQLPGSPSDSPEEKIARFSDFCFNKIQSKNINDATKKAILTLLKLRLEGGAI